MNDLISKSALIDALKIHFDSCFREDGELFYSDHICTSDDVVDLIKLVENQSTAYSVDKVVEQLEKLPKGSAWNHNSDNIDRKKTIEIVKGGGVDDN